MKYSKKELIAKVSEKTGYQEENIAEIYEALEERGYNPINQLVGYIMSGDPGYISSHKEARNKITKIERNKILEVILREYIKRI